MDLTPFEPFLERLCATRLAPWVPALSAAVERRLGPSVHGDLARWEAALAALPRLPAGTAVLDRSDVGLESGQRLQAAVRLSLQNALMALHPWRKGPFRFHDLTVDTEWRSDFKWDRLATAVTPLQGRVVLDVGCGNGYYAWRMLGAGAELVLGIDPTLLYVVQFQAINRYLRCSALSVLPLALEDLPGDLTGFDTLFSMGVLYHRRSPLDHLLDLRRLLRPGGELVLETLVIEGKGRQVLVPPGRYAGMRNVWLIPSVASLAAWLGRCDFKEVEIVDVTRTSVDEQRATPWMRFQSLRDQLSPHDSSLTVEGHPAPVRAILIAKRA
jgi:tRNA (mo5U34)-methyltransferase